MTPLWKRAGWPSRPGFSFIGRAPHFLLGPIPCTARAGNTIPPKVSDKNTEGETNQNRDRQIEHFGPRNPFGIGSLFILQVGVLRANGCQRLIAAQVRAGLRSRALFIRSGVHQRYHRGDGRHGCKIVEAVGLCSGADLSLPHAESNKDKCGNEG